MKQEAYDAIASAVYERYMESRNVARRKVVQLTGDIADVLASTDPGFDLVKFYRACHFTGDDIALIRER